MPDADAPTTEPEDYGYGTFTCKDCPPDANQHPRKAKQGPPPQRCDKHKAAQKRGQLSKLRESFGQEPVPEPQEQAEIEPAEDEAARDNEVTTSVAPPELERSWLDDEEAQELLKAKRQREVDTGVAYDPEVHGSVGDYLAGVDQQTADYADVDLVDYSDVGEEPGPAPAETKPEPGTCVLCGMENPPHVGLFCTPHWHQISLEERNILLGAAPDSAPFGQTVRRVIDKLTP